jgi:hypothetical protein
MANKEALFNEQEEAQWALRINEITNWGFANLVTKIDLSDVPLFAAVSEMIFEAGKGTALQE